ncbi:MAG: FHA domain-containing protein [Bacteroidales bacterium]|nr:FHA domain-containing protein [Bacteroidales bacterium]MCF8333709.1 FHA domain-containing protein [Bacteroidales bacterium]
MAKATQALTTGLKFMGGGNVQAYTLEYLSSSKKHPAGTYETIVVPYIEIGRHNSCAVKFGEDDRTVSRKHAAIERKGNETIIRNLSNTNPTLVNGHPVNKQYYLNNGDEIQLSMEGPRMRFNVSGTGTAKMGMTKKMNLVMQQAVRPYKTAAIGLVVFILLLSAGGGYAILNLSKENQLMSGKIAQQQQITQSQADSIALMNQKNKQLMANFTQTREEMTQKIEEERARLLKANQKLAEEIRKNQNSSTRYAEIIEPLKGKTLAIFLERVKVMYQDKVVMDKQFDPQCMCTGFLIGEGTFVTARHCIDNFLTKNDFLNFSEHSGANTVLYFSARSFDGKISFQFTNDEMIADYSKDEKVSVTYKGRTGVIRKPDYFSGADWAYMQTDVGGGMPSDPKLSASLKSGTELFVLGYSYGELYRKSGTMEPYFSTAKVALSGIQKGTINVTEAGFDGGNSGGPVFMLSEGSPKVIGIVTGKYRKSEKTVSGDYVMMDANIQLITPIANIE